MRRFLIVLSTFLLVCIVCHAEELTDFWLDFGVGSHLPRPVLESGVLNYQFTASNTEKDLKCRIEDATKDDFLQYVEKLKKYGFTTTYESGFDSYYAYHEDTIYSVKVQFYKKSNSLEINAWAHSEPTVLDIRFPNTNVKVSQIKRPKRKGVSLVAHAFCHLSRYDLR